MRPAENAFLEKGMVVLGEVLPDELLDAVEMRTRMAKEFWVYHLKRKSEYGDVEMEWIGTRLGQFEEADQNMNGTERHMLIAGMSIWWLAVGQRRM